MAHGLLQNLQVCANGGNYEVVAGGRRLAALKFLAKHKKIAVDYGLEGGAPGSKPGVVAMGHIYADSIEAFRAAFGPHAKEIMADIPNYTDIPPTIQISEIKVG